MHAASIAMELGRVRFVFLFMVLFGAVIGDIKWCIAPSTVHVSQNELCLSIQPIISNSFEFFGMQGEEESLQLLLDTRGWGKTRNMTDKVTLSFETFESSTFKGKELNVAPIVSWWQVGYVYCKATTRYEGSGGGWLPDPLLPPLNGSITLESEVTQPFWISVKIPSNYPPGVYNSSVVVTISSAGNTSSTITIPMSLTVWKIQLPPLAQSKFPAIFSFNRNVLKEVYGAKSDEVARKFEDILIDQRMGGNDLYSGTPANLTQAQYLAKAGVQWISLFDVYGVTGIDSLSREGKVQGACIDFTDDLIQKAIQILTPSITTARQMNILDNLFVYGFDEAPETCEQSIRNLYTALKAKWQDLRTVATVNWPPDTDIPIDVWVLQYEEYNKNDTIKWLQSGKQQWWYHCIEPSGVRYLNTFIERPQLQARLLFWLACAHDVSGWLYYSMVLWNRYPKSNRTMNRVEGTARTDFDPSNYIWYPRTDIFANGDGNFLYPGDDGPIATVRLHNLRDGFEDAEMFRQISSMDKVGNLINPLVRSATDYTLDVLLFETQRKKAAQEIVGN